MRYNVFPIFISVLILFFVSCVDSKTQNKNTTPQFSNQIQQIQFSLLNTYQHDSSLFTEGLLVYKGVVYESTGSPSELPHSLSMIGISDLKNGKFYRKLELDKSKYFGEGICIINDTLYQLTYKNQEGFVYLLPHFEKLKNFRFENKEGWGLTTDGTYLIMSDGTDVITYIDRKTLKPKRVLTVTGNGTPQNYLNELEYINGYLYANIWMTNLVVKIDPNNGKIVGQIDLSLLVSMEKTNNPNIDVLNGIAYDSEKDKIYVTGKLWSHVYEIDFNH